MAETEARPDAVTGQVAASHDAVDQAVEALDRGGRVAARLGRPDLGAHLAVARARLADHLHGVVVVGEFKRGKSTLVNAILQTEVCPVDADIATALPTLVRYGTPPSAVAHGIQGPIAIDTGAAAGIDAEPGAEADAGQPVDIDRLAEVVSEAGDPLLRSRIRSVEVRLEHRLLRTGLCLVDTPGIGGLDSAYGMVTLGALRSAVGLVFVTDAAQELTASEVDFLRQSLERCPRAVCVVTKTDLYQDWRRIVALDRAHLRHAGIDVPVLGVSSFLRLRARLEPEVNAESGFGPLFDWLRTEVVEAAAADAVSTSARELGFARQQLQAELEAEHLVLTEPALGSPMLQRLSRTEQARGRLAGAGAQWQQALTDGIQDLVSDVEHSLQERIRTLSRDADGVIDRTDPQDAWEALTGWLQREVVAAAVGNYEDIGRRALALARSVAEAFALESGEPRELAALGDPRGRLADLTLGAWDDPTAQVGETARMLFVGRSASFVPMAMFGIAGHVVGLAGLAVLGPMSVALGLGIGRKMLKDERLRQLTFRRQQAKLTVRRYLDEVSFVVGKDCRDTLRRIQRELRDDFQSRAAVLHASSQRALAGARRAVGSRPDERQTQAAHLVARRAELDLLIGPLAGRSPTTGRTAPGAAGPGAAGSVQGTPWTTR